MIPYFHQLGIVGVHDCGDEVSFGVLQELLAEDNLNLRVHEMDSLSNLDAAIKLGY